MKTAISGYSTRKGMTALDSINKKIWQTFHVHHGDCPPIMGFKGSRDTLAQLFADLGYKRGAEVGVQRGTYSRILCGCNPGLHLLCVDTWAPFTHHSQAWQDGQFAEAQRRLKDYSVEFIKKSSVEAAKDIPDGSLDFVYIDALHDFDNVMTDILAWAPNVRKDGIVSGHDYEHYYSCGVPKAVDAYAQAHNINLYYITPDDPPRSWFWRK